MKTKVKHYDYMLVPVEPYGEEEIYNTYLSALCGVNAMKERGVKLFDLYKYDTDRDEIFEEWTKHYDFRTKGEQ